MKKKRANRPSRNPLKAAEAQLKNAKQMLHLLKRSISND